MNSDNIKKLKEEIEIVKNADTDEKAKKIEKLKNQCIELVNVASEETEQHIIDEYVKMLQELYNIVCDEKESSKKTKRFYKDKLKEIKKISKINQKRIVRDGKKYDKLMKKMAINQQNIRKKIKNLDKDDLI